MQVVDMEKPQKQENMRGKKMNKIITILFLILLIVGCAGEKAVEVTQKRITTKLSYSNKSTRQTNRRKSTGSTTSTSKHEQRIKRTNIKS